MGRISKKIIERLVHTLKVSIHLGALIKRTPKKTFCHTYWHFDILTSRKTSATALNVVDAKCKMITNITNSFQLLREKEFTGL